MNEQKSEFTDLLHSGLNWQTNWTKLLKEIITKIGQNKDFFVNTSGLNEIADDGEWLFDLVWSELKYNESKTTVVNIPLVLESEISKINFGGFKEDFDKLFFAPNSTKIFVTRTIGNDETILKECIDYAQESVNNNININSKNGIHLITWREEKGFTLDYISSTEPKIKFTENVENIIFKKIEKENKLVFTKDIALAILDNISKPIESAFNNLNIDIGDLKKNLILVVDNDIKSKDISNLSLKTLKVFDIAPLEAKYLKHNEISLFILLLCILRNEQDNTAKMFNENGVYYENMGFEFLKSIR
ncbi:hypothetical protein V6246_00850 [Algibacter sp. TI.3.09]|uniref:hypothetical protein n=1 Tax=Algibacter sp. TI.3.09 TaxID=3121298 RepID=UPI00311D98EB